MDDQTPADAQLPDPDAQPPADDRPTPDEPEVAGSGRFAVYDKDELRYRGRVHDTRKAADDLKSELGKGERRGRYEVREV
jgi:hypothetical protein